MKLPEQIVAGPYTYNLFIDVENFYRMTQLTPGAPVRGLTHMETLESCINPGMAPDMTAETIVHEWLHMMVYAAQFALNEEAEEDLVARLSPVLLMGLRDNPELVSYVQKTTWRKKTA